MRRVLLLLLKAGVTVLLIYLSVRTVSLEAVRERLDDVSLSWMALVFGVLIFQIALQAVRWQQIVHTAGTRWPLAAAVRVSFIAAFFSQTLPSTIGGDAARIWMLAQVHKAGWRRATYSVFVDRAIGVFALAVLVAACTPWTFSFVQDPAARTAIALVGLFGITGGVIFTALGAAKGTWIERVWIAHHIVAAAIVLRRIAVPPQRALLVAALSIVIHLLTVFVAWSTARAIGAPAGLLLMACLIPPVTLIAAIPVTIAGWGLRESLMITAFALAGHDTGDAFAISLLMGAANFIVGLVGGLIWVSGRLTAAPMEAPDSAYERR